MTYFFVYVFPSFAYIFDLHCTEPVLFTGIMQWSIFVQGKEGGIEQHCVVVLHDDSLVLCLDPWLVLIG